MRVLVKRGSGEAGKRVSLDDDEGHHLTVRRARDGDRVEVLDGAGLRASGILVKAEREWMVQVDSATVDQQPAPLTLAVAAGDRDRFSWMVEKLVELGATKIVPLETNRTAGVATRLTRTHIDRLRRSALETIKQCGASWAPAVGSPVAFATIIREPLEGSGWLAEQSGSPVPASLDHSPATIIVGPEGGLTESEIEMAVSAGYRPVSLGIHTLRFETAALAAAAAVTQARMRGRLG